MGNKPKFYAVKVGKQPGIYQTWAECEGLVMGFNGAKYKSFPLRAEAEAWMAGETAASPVKAATASGSSDDKGKKRMMSPDVEDESSWDVVYSDGASKNNGKPNAVAGVGVWWGEGDPRCVEFLWRGTTSSYPDSGISQNAVRATRRITAPNS